MTCSAYKNGKCVNGFPADTMICYGSDEAAERCTLLPGCQRENEYAYPLTGHPEKEFEATKAAKEAS